MILSAEIGFTRLAAAAPRAALLSDAGASAPLMGLNVARIALSPTGGFRRRPYRGWAPPLHASSADARRVARAGALFVDARWNGAAVLAAAAALRGAPPDAVRTRGERLWPHMSIIAGSVADGDTVWGPPAEVWRADDLDEMARFAAAQGMTIRNVASGAEALFDPVATLDAPDDRQRDGALGEGRALFDAEGGARLAIPTIGAARGPVDVGLTVAGLQPEDPSPRPGGDLLEWTAERSGPLWRMRARARAGEAVRLRLSGAASPTAEFAEIWCGVPRPTLDSDGLWDEASAILELEGDA